MGNEGTKAQLKRFFDRAVDEAKNPDPRKIQKHERKKRRKRVAKKFGL